jgi:hypothetical protein
MSMDTWPQLMIDELFECAVTIISVFRDLRTPGSGEGSRDEI